LDCVIERYCATDGVNLRFCDASASRILKGFTENIKVCHGPPGVPIAAAKRGNQESGHRAEASSCEGESGSKKEEPETDSFSKLERHEAPCGREWGCFCQKYLPKSKTYALTAVLASGPRQKSKEMCRWRGGPRGRRLEHRAHHRAARRGAPQLELGCGPASQAPESGLNLMPVIDARSFFCGSRLIFVFSLRESCVSLWLNSIQFAKFNSWC
jgi:hypothetical protein